MSQPLNDMLSQILLGILIAGIVGLIAQVYYIDLKIAGNQKYVAMIDRNQKDIGKNADKIELIETRLLNHFNTSH